MYFQIAIDGPAGSGKSTAAKRLAAELGFVYIDTGAMYRAVALHCMRIGADLDDPSAITEAMDTADVRIKYEDGAQRVFLGSGEVTAEIRAESVGNAASGKVSVIPAVRERLVEMQRRLAESTSVIMDGRDIGTVVLPNANLKIYLDASASERTKRRCDELSRRGEQADREKIAAEIAARDYSDTHREHSPLRRADDAVYLDSSDMEIEEVIAKIVGLARERRDA